MASYARMADDDTLYNMARRIQGRAVRRVGELLKQYDGQGHRSDIKPRDGAGPKSQKQAATEAGMSKRQQVTAVRVANIPNEDFRKLQSGDTIAWHQRKPFGHGSRRRNASRLLLICC